MERRTSAATSGSRSRYLGPARNGIVEDHGDRRAAFAGGLPARRSQDRQGRPPAAARRQAGYRADRIPAARSRNRIGEFPREGLSAQVFQALSGWFSAADPARRSSAPCVTKYLPETVLNVIAISTGDCPGYSANHHHLPGQLPLSRQPTTEVRYRLAQLGFFCNLAGGEPSDRRTPAGGPFLERQAYDQILGAPPHPSWPPSPPISWAVRQPAMIMSSSDASSQAPSLGPNIDPTVEPSIVFIAIMMHRCAFSNRRTM